MKRMFATALVALASVGAHADGIDDYVRVELGAGISRYTTQPDGTWYQQGMPHTLNLNAPVWSVGFTGPIWQRGNFGVDWHVDYVNLGHISSQCTCTPLDINYNDHTHKLITPLVIDVPNANFVGNGNAQGIALTLEPYWLYRGWRFGIEGGLFPYRPSFDEYVYGWQLDPKVAPSTLLYATPHTVQLGGVVGASVSRGKFTVAYQHYFLPTRYAPQNGQSPALWKGADVLMVKYRF